ncbi:unnamed protein product [Litomosoides sigmodontis]|uniref:MICOS complex subunit MIC10 n=1 Tax=Litomosoides sigmodontis TaxID=42156 RepID=A0A3P6T1A6_LITSI|nr:unnamed protein product [Litomosoides sigmodontis]
MRNRHINTKYLPNIATNANEFLINPPLYRTNHTEEEHCALFCSVGNTHQMAKKSEDELNATFDRCLADTALKTVSAGTVGLIAAAIFKRQFPLWLGVGMGFGMGIANCRHDMRKSFIHSKQESEQKSNLKMIEESGNAKIQSQ